MRQKECFKRYGPNSFGHVGITAQEIYGPKNAFVAVIRSELGGLSVRTSVSSVRFPNTT